MKNREAVNADCVRREVLASPASSSAPSVHDLRSERAPIFGLAVTRPSTKPAAQTSTPTSCGYLVILSGALWHPAAAGLVAAVTIQNRTSSSAPPAALSVMMLSHFR